MVREFDEAVTDWLPLELVSDQFDILHYSVLIEEILDVLLVHPGFDIADPERLCSDLARLLIC